MSNCFVCQKEQPKPCCAYSDLEAKDARIKELGKQIEFLKETNRQKYEEMVRLNALIEKMKCCGNCSLNDCVRKDTNDFCVGCSQRWERWEPREPLDEGT